MDCKRRGTSPPCRARVHIILGCRNVALGNEVAEELNRSADESVGDDGKANRKSEAECIHLDLASFASVRAFASAVISRSKQLGVPIHGCVNNAGVYSVKGTTADGYQITFQTNTLAPALLTTLLLPSLQKAMRDLTGFRLICFVVVPEFLHNRFTLRVMRPVITNPLARVCQP